MISTVIEGHKFHFHVFLTLTYVLMDNFLSLFNSILCMGLRYVRIKHIQIMKQDNTLASVI